jgi:hypothetical protein
MTSDKIAETRRLTAYNRGDTRQSIRVRTMSTPVRYAWIVRYQTKVVAAMEMTIKKIGPIIATSPRPDGNAPSMPHDWKIEWRHYFAKDAEHLFVQSGCSSHVPTAVNREAGT